MMNLYEGLLFKPDHRSFHPIVNIVSITLQFGLSIILPLEYLILLLFMIVIESLLIRHFKNLISLIKAIFALLVMVGLLTLFFGGPTRAISIVLKLILGAIMFSIFFASTNPYELSKTLEKLKIPQKYAYIPSLSISLLPRTAKDASDTFETLLFRGEIQDSYYRWIPRTISILIASTLYRSEFIAQSLYIRNFGNKSRKVYGTHPMNILDISKVTIYLVFTLLLISTQIT